MNGSDARLRWTVDLGGALMVALLVGIAGSLTIGGGLQRANALKKERVAVREQVQQYEQIQSVLTVADSSLRELQSRMSSDTAVVPEEMNFPRFYDEVSRMADSFGVEIEQMDPGPTQRTGDYYIMPVLLTSNAAFESFYMFLHNLTGPGRPVRVERMSIESDVESERLRIALSLELVSQKDGGRVYVD